MKKTFLHNSGYAQKDDPVELPLDEDTIYQGDIYDTPPQPRRQDDAAIKPPGLL